MGSFEMKRLALAVALVVFAAGALGCEPKPEQTRKGGAAVATASGAGAKQEGAASDGQKHPEPPFGKQTPAAPEGLALATFAGGCFWCMEKPFETIEGVKWVISGYSGGDQLAPTYDQVANKRTNHLEAVQILFDPKVVTYDKLLDTFWRNINPTQDDGQFVDRGPQYRSAIFTHDEAQQKAAAASKAALGASGRFNAPIVTELRPYKNFWPAEDYHQDFYKKSPVRYHGYRRGSGRDDYIKKVWGDAKH